MAKFIISIDEDLERELSRLGERSAEIAGKALYAGMEILADEIRKNLEALPEDEFRYLDTARKEQFNGVPKGQKEDLLAAFGVSKVAKNRQGVYTVKAGFSGYSKLKTKKYPKGVPLEMIARSIESGSSVRKKTPFIRPAMERNEDRIVNAMESVIAEEIAKVLE